MQDFRSKFLKFRIFEILNFHPCAFFFFFFFCVLVSSVTYFCYFLTSVSIWTNIVDLDQTAPTVAVRPGSTLFVEKASITFQQMTKADDLLGLAL